LVRRTVSTSHGSVADRPTAGRDCSAFYDRVAAMNGELRVHSPPGGGTTVAASIPLREP
jgi:hypothetical protein